MFKRLLLRPFWKDFSLSFLWPILYFKIYNCNWPLFIVTWPLGPAHMCGKLCRPWHLQAKKLVDSFRRKCRTSVVLSLIRDLRGHCELKCALLVSWAPPNIYTETLINLWQKACVKPFPIFFFKHKRDLELIPDKTSAS